MTAKETLNKITPAKVFDAFMNKSGLSGWFNLRGSDGLTAQQRALNAFKATEAEKNRQFQERMSNTSMQRGVSDAVSAGLNPYIALSNGGASTPSGAVADSAGNDTSGLERLASLVIQGVRTGGDLVTNAYNAVTMRRKLLK